MEKKMVDARGLACPLPVVNAKKAVEEMKQGGELTVLVDNEIAVQNLQKFAKQKGLESTGAKKAEKEYEVIDDPPKTGKDFNDFWMQQLGISMKKQSKEREKTGGYER